MAKRPLNPSMRLNASALTAIIGLSVAGALAAQTQVDWYKVTDSKGNVSYQDTPPLGDERFEEKISKRNVPNDDDAQAKDAGDNTASQLLPAVERWPILLYVKPRCGKCSKIKTQLDQLNVPYKTLDVQLEPGLKQVLREKTKSSTVPAIVIGDEFSRDTNPLVIKQLLIKTHYLLETPKDTPSI